MNITVDQAISIAGLTYTLSHGSLLLLRQLGKWARTESTNYRQRAIEKHALEDHGVFLSDCYIDLCGGL